ncbi:MAG: PaaI family thioesterase [Calditrichota bacterium]
MTSLEKQFFQDQMSGNHCFGCGTDNENGLQIKSYWSSEKESTCIFHPKPHHAAGPQQYMNGGISATVIDCHTVCTATARHYRDEGREIGSGDLIWCVTASLELQYKKPVLIDKPVKLIARLEKEEGKKTYLSCELYSDDTLCITATVLAIRVSDKWTNPKNS